MDLQAVLKQLDEGDRALRASVAGVTDDIARREPAPGSWSVLQCLEHLVLAEDYMFGLIVSASPVDEPVVNERRELAISERGTDRTRRLEAPKLVHPQGAIVSIDAGLAGWAVTRARTRAFVERCTEDLRCRLTMHPILGQATAYEILLVIAVHPSRHAQQIAAARAAAGS